MVTQQATTVPSGKPRTRCSRPLPHLRAWRQYKGLTQRTLAERTQLAIITISALEQGERQAFRSTRLLLATALGLTTEQLESKPPADYVPVLRVFCKHRVKKQRTS